MGERLPVPQTASLFERLFDIWIRVEHALAAEQLDVFVEVARRSDRRVNLEAVFHAGVEVVRAMPGCRMDRTGAGIERDVVAEHADGITLIQRMPETNALELRALHLRHRICELPADDLADGLGQTLSEDDRTAVDVERRVVELR